MMLRPASGKSLQRWIIRSCFIQATGDICIAVQICRLLHYQTSFPMLTEQIFCFLLKRSRYCLFSLQLRLLQSMMGSAVTGATEILPINYHLDFFHSSFSFFIRAGKPPGSSVFRNLLRAFAAISDTARISRNRYYISNGYRMIVHTLTRLYLLHTAKSRDSDNN